jgi:Zn-dependent peptidase ImmA (M78 family)
MKTVQLQPSVFEWLCKSSGWTPMEIAEKISKPIDTVTSWYNGESNPSLSVSELKLLSAGFKRPLTAFLLSTPPKNECIPEDFRKVIEPDRNFSKETFLMIRRARRTLRLWKELSDNVGESVEISLPSYYINQDPEEIAQKERERLNIIYPPSWKDDYAAYRFWRELFSQLQILVLQLNMPVEDARGFSIVEDRCAAIVVNGRDSVKGRIFTISHEYAHLLLHEYAVCNNESDTSGDPHTASVERWCNMFAGAFLLPRVELEDNKTILRYIMEQQYEKAADKIASHFKVSKDAALIRLRVLDLISESELHKIRSQIPPYKASPIDLLSSEKKKFKHQSKEKTSLTENGEKFVSLVLKNEELGEITYYDALDYLNVKSFDELRAHVMQA